MAHQVNAAARLDRLPIAPFHWRVLWLIGIGMFFDSFDTSMMAGVLGALVQSHYSTMADNARFISVTFIGISLGAALAGVVGDKLGRRFAIRFNLLLFGSMALISALAPSMSALIALRGVMGIGLGAEFVVGYGMLTEFVPPGVRGRAIAIVSLISSSGVFVVSLVNLIVIPTLGWRAMFVIGGVGALWAWYLRLGLPESPRWLEAAGRHAEAETVLAAIEAEVARRGPLPPVPVQADVIPRRIPFTALLVPPLLRCTLLAMAVCIVSLVGSYSFVQWVPSFFVQQGMSMTRSLSLHTAMTLGTIAGPTLCILLSDRIGRRWGIAGCGVICCVLGLIYPQVQAPFALMGCGFLLVTFMSLFLSLGLGTYTPELFPTECRMSGSGVSQLTGRLALIAAPYGVLVLFNLYGVTGVVGSVAALYLLVALAVALFGTETLGRSLEQIVDEEVSARRPERPA
jgi:putative MFS transporter